MSEIKSTSAETNPSLQSPSSPPSPEGDYPIHLINAIQPHGLLLALDDVDFSILQVSANTQAYLGVEPEALLGKPLDVLCDTAPLRSWRESLASENPAEPNRPIPMRFSVKISAGVLDGVPAKTVAFDSFIHRTDGVVIVEMEPAVSAGSSGFLSVHALARNAIERMQQADTSEALLKVVVDEIRRLTGFDRVLVYRFDEQGAGSVIAEAKQAEVTPFLGLHFPAQDVPTVSRDLYDRGKLRTIPNIPAIAVPLIPYQNPKTQKPLDLSLSTLRSSDACSVEYYRNMGVAAAMVASIRKDQHLWGLIACHHITAKKLSYETKAACELLAQVASSELGNKVRQADLIQRARTNTLQAGLLASIAQADNFLMALRQPEERLLALVNASGAVIRLDDDWTLLGATPTKEQVQQLAHWATEQTTGNLFDTDCLSQDYPEAEAFKETASGLLFLQLSRLPNYQILWFRPEVLQTVNWAGPPDDGIEVDETGQQQMNPRRSFERWQESVQATALPWQPYEREGAIALRNAIVGIVLKKADELAHLNRDLQASNRELASFAYAAAHDLKEPLRGIYNYANILVEDYSSALDEEGLEYLNDIQVFSQRMEVLINALLRIAGLRQTQLKLETVDLNTLLNNAVDIIRASRPERTFDLRVPKALPQVACDPVLVNEIFRNLISNALKYNDHSEKWIEVGCQEAAPDQGEPPTKPVFFVRDNGIGIRQAHREMVFKLFKRLHPQDRYDGGAGVGLAVVAQIIERHGGRIWVESEVGEGSTFYFTL